MTELGRQSQQAAKQKEPQTLLAINVALPLLIAACLGVLGTGPTTRGIALITAIVLAGLNARGVWTAQGKWRAGYACFGMGNLLALAFFADFSLTSLLVTWLRFI